MEKSEVNVDYHSDTVYRERCDKYQNLLEVIARAIRFHREQALAFKGT